MLDQNAIIITVKPLVLDRNISPLKLFTPLSNQSWSIWLDSCESNHVDCRYDIMVWQPNITLITIGNSTTIHNLENNTTQMSEEDPLLLLKEVQEKLFSEISIMKSDVPFKGGAVGYFSYDLGRRFEVLPTTTIQDINLADMAVGIYTQAIIFDRKTQSLFLVCPEDKRKNIEKELQLYIFDNENEPSFKLTKAWQANMSKSEYQQKFYKVQDYLLSGDCYQINLAQRFTASYQGDEFSAYKALRTSNQAPFSAFMRLNESAILSISPERFLQVKQSKVQSKPIKGTRPRDSNLSKDRNYADELLHSEKDKAENLMIVDLLRNDLSKVCEPGSVIVPKLFEIESFPAVHHLVSTVEGILSPKFHTTDLLRGAFPGGSITGAPKIRAMEIIEELEPHQRSVYCGSIGYISACGNMDTSITIRTLVCKNSNIYCWAGGGLVVDSKIDSEYQETFDKVNKILPVLAAL